MGREKIRKKRKAEGKAQREAKRAERAKKKGNKVGRVKKRYVDQFGNIFYKAVGSKIKVQERGGVQRTKDLKVTAHTYGKKNQDNAYRDDQNNGDAGSYEVGVKQAPVENPLVRPEQVIN